MAPTEIETVVKAPVPVVGIFVPDSDRAVRSYVSSQLSPRSKENAIDALRRLTRLLSNGKTNDPALFPWATINVDVASKIRALLYEVTRTGGLTPSTANLTLSHLRGLVRTMYSMELVDQRQYNLMRDGALKNVPGSRQERGRALAPREEQALRKAARCLDGYRGAMLDTAIVLAVGAGLRREEIARLAVAGLTPGKLTVIGKGNKERSIPVDPQMQTAVDAWLGERAAIAPTHGGLFCSPQRPEALLSPWSFWALVREAAHAAFGDRNPCDNKCRCLVVVTGPHDFRRTFATRLLEQGLDIGQVKVFMGHESLETTARYDKRDVEALFEKRRNMKVIA